METTKALIRLEEEAWHALEQAKAYRDAGNHDGVAYARATWQAAATNLLVGLGVKVDEGEEARIFGGEQVSP